MVDQEHNHEDECCTVDPEPTSDHDHGGHSHGHGGDQSFIQTWGWALLSAFLLLAGIGIQEVWQPAFFEGGGAAAWFGLAYLPVGLPVLWKAFKTIRKGDIFTEFFLMGLATVGAFAIGEYPEGVAVMLFYAVGELFQDAAVSRAKRNIKALLDIRPDIAHVIRNGKVEDMHPEKVVVGQRIQVKPGEKIPLDGVIVKGKSSFNTSALTGESKPEFLQSRGNRSCGND